MKHAARSSRVPGRSRLSSIRIAVGGLSVLILVGSLAGAAGFPGWTPIPSDDDLTVVSDDASDDVSANRALAFEDAQFPDLADRRRPADDTGQRAENQQSDTELDGARENWPDTARENLSHDAQGPKPPPDPKKEPVSSFDDPLPLPENSGEGRRVVFSISDQYVWLVAQGDTIERRYPVSGSRYDQLEPGSYDVIRTRRHTTSWHGTESMEYMVTFTFGENAAIGFHDIPKSLETGKRVQTADELGMALSDGCIRQRPRDAAALWEFAPTDTPVIVVE